MSARDDLATIIEGVYGYDAMVTADAIIAAGWRPPLAKKAAPVVEPFAPNTGDPALDAFMRAHHDPKWKAPALPKPAAAPKLPKASKIGTWLEATDVRDAAARLQVVGQGYEAGQWHATDGVRTFTVVINAHDLVVSARAW